DARPERREWRGGCHDAMLPIATLRGPDSAYTAGHCPLERAMKRPDTRSAWWRLGRLITAALAAVGLAGACDLQNIAELEPGVSTEADVREKFGAPEAVWDGADGLQIYEYNRQPEGVVN